MPVANKPILFYGLEAIVEAGITEIGIVVGDTHAEIREAVGDGSRFGAKVCYIQQSAPLGLAHAVKESRPFLGDDSFVMYLGDNFLREGIADFVREFEEHRPDAQILLVAVPNPQDFGVAELDGDRVTNLEEKPQSPRSNLALVGVYMFTPEIFRSARAIAPSGRGELEITDAIQDLVDRGLRVEPHVVQGWWKDTGQLADMLEANRLVLDVIEPLVAGEMDEASSIEGRVVLEAGARLVRSSVRGPAVIGRGTLIEDAYVGPYSAISENCVVRRAEIEHSILLEGSEIRDLDARVEASLIGRGARIGRSHEKPRAYRFLVGDESSIGLV